MYKNEVSFMVWLCSTKWVTSSGKDDKILALKAQTEKDAIQEIKEILKGPESTGIHHAYLFEIVGEDAGPIDNAWKVCKSINPKTEKVLDLAGCVFMSADDSLGPDYLRLYSLDKDHTWWIYVSLD